jgi:uncharacterized protein
MSSRILVDRNVPIRMRDGVRLMADIYRLDTNKPLPGILCRLPYNKDDPLMQMEAVNPIRAAEAGYAVVYQDTRGRFQSEGEFYPFTWEGRDGFDTVEWIAAQSWCNGSIGMAGASYFGATQWLAAIEQPPHLKAIFPVVTSSEYYDGWMYQGGAFQLGLALLWVVMGLAPDTATRLAGTEPEGVEQANRFLLATDAMYELYRHLPLSTMPLLRSNRAARYYFDWLAHETRDAYWQKIAVNQNYDRIQVPAYNVGGWFDLFLHGTLENYTRMHQEGGSEVARSGQRLLVTPWAHGNFTGDFPDFHFGVFSSATALDLCGQALNFFDFHLKGIQDRLDVASPVRIFVMGENRWRDEKDWPIPGTAYVPWYLHSQGTAGSGMGTLSTQQPLDEPNDVFLYDPRNPVPTAGGSTFLPGLRFGINSGPKDQHNIEDRQDVLTFSSAPLEQPLEVTGPLTVNLWASTSAVDTDFVVRLCDVWPDGTSRLLAEGILRARYREGFEQPVWLQPGRVYLFKIDLVATSNVFMPGHQIRVDVMSSSWPRFNVNPNIASPLGAYSGSDLTPALQTVFHDGNFPSHIILPVISGRRASEVI